MTTNTPRNLQTEKANCENALSTLSDTYGNDFRIMCEALFNLTLISQDGVAFDIIKQKIEYLAVSCLNDTEVDMHNPDYIIINRLYGIIVGVTSNVVRMLNPLTPMMIGITDGINTDPTLLRSNPILPENISSQK